MSTKAEQEQAIENLKHVLKRGDTVYCFNAKPPATSREYGAGTLFEIKFYKITSKGDHWLSYNIAKLLGLRIGKLDGVLITGGGMDMATAILSQVGRRLFGNEGALKHRWL